MKISLLRLDEDLGVLSEIESVVLSKDMGLQALHENTGSTRCIFLGKSDLQRVSQGKNPLCIRRWSTRGTGGRSEEKEFGQSCLLSQ